MKDDFEPRLRAELLALAKAVPTEPRGSLPTPAGAGTRTSVRWAGTERSRGRGLRLAPLALVFLVVAAIAVAGLGPRLLVTPAQSASVSPSGSASPSATVSPSASASRSPFKLGAFSRTGSMLTGRSGQTVTLLEDGRVLTAGGNDGSQASPQPSCTTPGPASSRPRGR